MMRHLRVLLLSDLPEDSDRIRQLLSEQGFEPEILTIRSASEIENTIAQSSCDLVLADTRLTGETGSEALDLFHAQNVDLPFIVLTDREQIERALHAMKAGAHDFIHRDDLVRLGPSVERELREARVRRDRQRAFRALRRSEERYRAAVDRSLFSFFILESIRDETGRIVDFSIVHSNPQGLELLGRPRQDVINSRLSEKLPGLAQSPLMDAYRAVAETGTPHEEQVEVINQEMKARWVHHLAVPLGDGVAVTMADISDRQQYRLDLEHFFDLPLALLAVVDAEGNLLRANPAWERLLNWEQADLVGQSIDRLIHPDDLPAAQKVLERLGDDQARTTFEARMRTRDGAYRTIMWTSAKTSGQYYHVGQDVTEIRRTLEDLRHSEARYRAIVEDQTEMICRYDPEGKITFVNAPFARHLKADPEELVGMNRFDLVPHQQSLELRNLHVQMLDDNQETGTIDQRYRSDDAGMRWERWRVRALRDINGEVREFQSVGMDITERRKAREDQERMDERLRHIQKMEALGTLASGVAHDFSNLLTVIFGYTDLASKLLPRGHPAQNYLKTIEKVATRATGVTNSLLTFSQRKASEKRPVNLNELANESIRLLRRVIPRSIDMIESIDSEPVWVIGDETQLQQVIMNLALNARDAMPEGGKLELIVGKASRVVANPGSVSSANGHHGSQEREQAILVISDTGEGMEKAVVERIFEPFFSTKPRGQGTGLGLSIADSIITDHGGRIEVQSEPGQGARFTLFFPTVHIENTTLEKVVEEEEMAGSGESVLVVEDDDFVRSIIVSALDEEGYCTIEVEDGQIAVEQVEKCAPQLSMVILDLDLPKIHGSVVLERIRQLRPDLPVMIVTGNPDNSAFGKQQDAVTHLVNKPFQISHLLKLIMKILRDAEKERSSDEFHMQGASGRRPRDV